MWIVYTIMFVVVATITALWVCGIDKNKDIKGDDSF